MVTRDELDVTTEVHQIENSTSILLLLILSGLATPESSEKVIAALEPYIGKDSAYDDGSVNLVVDASKVNTKGEVDDAAGYILEAAKLAKKIYLISDSPVVQALGVLFTIKHMVGLDKEDKKIIKRTPNLDHAKLAIRNEIRANAQKSNR